MTVRSPASGCIATWATPAQLKAAFEYANSITKSFLVTSFADM
jgi:hypothetical protein